MHLLTEMMNSKRPVRLIIENLVNLLVFITVHDTTFKGGEPDDIYFDLTARMWRQPKVHTKAGSAAGSGNSGGGSNRPDLKKRQKPTPSSPATASLKLPSWSSATVLNGRLFTI